MGRRNLGKLNNLPFIFYAIAGHVCKFGVWRMYRPSLSFHNFIDNMKLQKNSHLEEQMGNFSWIRKGDRNINVI